MKEEETEPFNLKPREENPMLKGIPTCQLFNELKGREGVTAYTMNPEASCKLRFSDSRDPHKPSQVVKQDGPATILIVID